MSAPSLTSLEQKFTISGKKKKKKTVKNILGIPDGSKVECYTFDLNEVTKLHEILNRLLPLARLPVQPNPKFNKNVEQVEADPEVREKAKNKRDQLSLGVNTLSQNIKKNLISAVLLANDIQPRFLTNHLNLLCHHNGIPFLYVSQLREITAVCLGFPCIAVGFKKDSCDFSEAVEEIKSLYQTKSSSRTTANEVRRESKPETEAISCDLNVVEISNPKKVELKTPFVYLYRNSVNERAFVPENERSDMENKSKSDFISVGNEVDDVIDNTNVGLGISSNLIKKQQKTKAFKHFVKSSFDDDGDLEVPKKKPKKEWIADNVGTKQKYQPAKIHKISSNINRKSKKK